MKVKRLKNGRYQARWRDSTGRQRAKNFVDKPGIDTMAQLMAAAERLGTELRYFPPEHAGPTFGEFARGWLTKYAALQQSQTTLFENGQLLERHLLPLFGNCFLEDLKRTDLAEAKVALAAKTTRGGKPLKPKTVNLILSLAKQIMQTAFELELVKGNVWASVKLLPVPKQAFAFWSFEEKERFLAFCRKADPAFAELVLVAVESGLRRGELMALRCGDLDFDQRKLWVRGSYAVKLKSRLDRTKNGEVDDYVPMSEAVFRTLLSRKRAAAGSPVFEAGLFADYYKRLRRRCKTAGVTEIRFHDLRHTFASHLVMNGVPLYTVRDLMRHSSITMTERYAKLAPDTLADAIKKVSATAVHSIPQGETQVLEFARK